MVGLSGIRTGTYVYIQIILTTQIPLSLSQNQKYPVKYSPKASSFQEDLNIPEDIPPILLAFKTITKGSNIPKGNQYTVWSEGK